MALKEVGDIAAGRLDRETLLQNFDDVAPPLDHRNAVLAANRCYYCYNAPCIQSCPTGIDIPGFIRKISNENVKGAATDILSANIMGGACARVCPTEILCEGACVRNTQEANPVEISALQRYATDWLFERDIQLFERGADTGRHVAVVGAGPAGLACAHALAVAGHRVTVFEAREKPGGLNEYGVAAYKVPHQFAQREVDYILQIGGIEVRTGSMLGRDLTLAQLRADFDAVFLAMGLAGVRALEAEGETLAGVRNAVEFIDELRQCADLSTLPVGRRVVVIGGGNTAIDAAVQSKRLGAESVTLIYRRGADAMSATWVEQEFAQTDGVTIKHWAQPRRVLGRDGAVTGVEFEHTRLDAGGKLVGSGDYFTIAADMVLKAIGQTLVPAGLDRELLQIENGRIVVNAERATSLPGVWAGGDCALGNMDLTVQAVEDGKRAAQSIDRALRHAARKAA